MQSQGHSSYGTLADIYDPLLLTLTGFKRGVENFLGRINFELPPEARILDAGCGTGLLAFWLKKRFPDAEFLSFDIDRRMLEAMERIRLKEGISKNNFTIAWGNLEVLQYVRDISCDATTTLSDDYFDLISTSGALEHVSLQETVFRLAKLLKPGGMLFNLGVRRNPAGAALGMVLRFKPYSVEEMRSAFEGAGLEDIRVIRLSPKDFPANLSRVAILGRKSKTV